MCGISGMIGEAEREVIQSMNRAMLHRGPDDEGILVDARHRVCLGHRRLSILDTSTAAHQPMSSKDGRYSLVFNGEIYNFVAIRRELERQGRQFRSSGDTEVLLAAFETWGPACLERLRGMFAFAIFDRGDGAGIAPSAFLARDRLGIKPLYYAVVDGVLLFASEIKAMLASGRVSRRVDHQALLEYLSLGAVAQPRTILAGVRALMPGHSIRVELPLQLTTYRYWDIAKNARESYPDVADLGAAEAAARLRSLLDEATQLHLLADVPVGAFLSGGIDSTAIVGLMSRISRRRIETYSIGFEGASPQSDELPWAGMAAKAFDAKHTEVVVTGRELAGIYDRIVEAIDQPSLDGTNTYLVSKAAAGSVKVALSGLGGDELFAGYPHFPAHARLDRWDRRLGWLGEHARRRILRHVPGRMLRDKQMLMRSTPERYATLRNLCADPERSAVASTDLLDAADSASLLGLYAEWSDPDLDSVARTSYVEVNGYLVNTLLRDVDAMAMAHSLEVRPVLLDHVVAEFAFALPSRLKLDPTVNKPLLVNALRDVLPDAIVNRRKSGFELPLTSWLAGPLRERALSSFSSPAARRLFSPAFLGGIHSQASVGQAPNIRVWAYLMLVEWLNFHGLEP